MARWCMLGLLAWLLVGCGARTGFDGELISTEANASSGGGGTIAPAQAASESGPFCAFNVGPVSSCDAGISAGPVQQCVGTFRDCVDVGGHWGCCSSPSNNNGAGGSCRFPEFGLCNGR